MSENPPIEELNATSLLSDFAVGIPTLLSAHIKEHAAKFPNHDQERVLLGHILFRIIGDDENFFNAAMIKFDRKVNRPNEADKSRTELIRRIGWELEQPQTPEQIKTLLTKAVAKLRDRAWTSEHATKEARKVWEDETRSSVKQLVDGSAEWKKTIDEYFGFIHEARGAGIEI
ncbi:MAG: hypothetical protein ACOYT7_01655 [Patescibacteria group bacterium]